MVRPDWPSRDSAFLWAVAALGPLTAGVLYVGLIAGPFGFRPVEQEIVAIWVALPLPAGAYLARWIVGARGAPWLCGGFLAAGIAAIYAYWGNFGPGSHESLAGLVAIFLPLLQGCALPVLILLAWWIGRRPDARPSVELPRAGAILPRRETDR